MMDKPKDNGQLKLLEIVQVTLKEGTKAVEIDIHYFINPS
jgi:hypothetical protein